MSAFTLMNRALSKAFKDSEAHCKQLESKNINFFKPWLIILASGFSLDSLSNLIDVYKKLEYPPVCFPFLIDDQSLVQDKVLKFNQIKPFMILRNLDVSSLFLWIKNMMIQRLTISENESMKLPKSAFEGWIKL